MRTDKFYKACDRAVEAKTTKTAAKHLRLALAEAPTILTQAAAKLEITTVLDVQDTLRWALTTCIWNHGGAPSQWPGLPPSLFGVYGCQIQVGVPPVSKQRKSTDYRWGRSQEKPETYLPSVPMSPAWPRQDDRRVIEFAR